MSVLWILMTGLSLLTKTSSREKGTTIDECTESEAGVSQSSYLDTLKTVSNAASQVVGLHRRDGLGYFFNKVEEQT